jgi:hypothetical protein
MAARPSLAAALAVVSLVVSPAYAQQPPATALNQQLQFGDVFGSMTVISPGDVPEGAQSLALAAGNTVSGANMTGGLTASSTQGAWGRTTAASTLQVRNTSTATAVANAQANALEAQTSGGKLDIEAGQYAYDTAVSATTNVSIRNAQQLNAASSAAANNVALGATNGDLRTRLHQETYQSVSATSEAEACCTGSSSVSASATGNAIGSTSQTSTVDAQYDQAAWTDSISATARLRQVTGYNATAATTAAANSATIDNKWGYADIRGRQDSTANVSASSDVALDTWAYTATSAAYGVGNSTLATNIGSDMRVNLEQGNSGGVATTATFNGGTNGVQSGNAVVSATSLGNAFTGYVCSRCGDAALTGTVSQTNSGSITATGTMNAIGATTAAGSASAIGNTATFITTSTNGG